MKFNKYDILKILTVNRLGKGSLVGKNLGVQHMIAYTVHRLKKAGWIQEDIEKVIEESISGNYFHTHMILSLCLIGSKTLH